MVWLRAVPPSVALVVFSSGSSSVAVMVSLCVPDWRTISTLISWASYIPGCPVHADRRIMELDWVILGPWQESQDQDHAGGRDDCCC
jgi:hypothetical protein